MFESKTVVTKENALVPMTVKRTSDGERSMDIYSRLLDDRIIMISESISSELASIVVAQLLYLESQDPTKGVDIYIDSPGGSVTAGMAIYDTMRYIQCPVRTIVTGLAASMGSFLLVGGDKGERYAMPHAEIMIHQPLISGGLSGQQTDISIHAKNLEKCRERLEKILAERSGNTYEKMHSLCERDNYLTAEEALALGLIDKIVEPKKGE